MTAKILGLNKLSRSSGVYLFKDADGRILYIGKASNLRNRVSSYFQPSAALSPRIAKMVQQVHSVEVRETEGEIPALLLEAELIKQYQPPYNVRNKDDKSASYISIDYSHNFPIVKLARTISNPQTKAFGPYPETNLTWVVKAIRKMFPWRDCGQQKFRRHAKLDRPCLYGDLKLCPKPCVGHVSQLEYLKDLKLLAKFLTSGGKRVLRELKGSMRQAANQRNYEQAAALRDQIARIEKIITWKSSAELDVSFPSGRHTMVEALEELRHLLPRKTRRVGDFKPDGLGNWQGWYPHRIEAFDISNLQGQQAVGSMVVFTEGVPDKSEYRRFKIKTVKGANDPAMMAEVVRRRLKRWPHNLPDLILVDGGKGQVSAVLQVLKEEAVVLPVVGLAKREELLVIPLSTSPTGLQMQATTAFKLVKLASDSSALQLLQCLRDESHRFALRYHRHLRRAKIPVV